MRSGYLNMCLCGGKTEATISPPRIRFTSDDHKENGQQFISVYEAFRFKFGTESTADRGFKRIEPFV